MTRKPKPTKRKPPNRGRANQPPLEVLAHVNQLVRWRPGRFSPPDAWVLCYSMGLRLRYGHWDYLLIPVAGGGSWWAELDYIAPYGGELTPASLLDQFQVRADTFFKEQTA